VAAVAKKKVVIQSASGDSRSFIVSPGLAPSSGDAAFTVTGF